MAEKRPEHDTSQQKSTGKRVLIVDDNVDAAQTLGMLLELEGHTTECAYDGRMAVELAQSFRPEVALVDIGLPGLDGYGIARSLRAMPELPNLKLVAIAGRPYQEDMTEAGFDAYRGKPVAFEDLQEFLT